MENEVTTGEILSAVNQLGSAIQANTERILKLDAKMDAGFDRLLRLESKVEAGFRETYEALNAYSTDIDRRYDNHEVRITRLERQAA